MLNCNIRKREVIRYLGYKTNAPDEQVQILIDSCIEEVKKISEPVYFFKRFNLKISDDSRIQIEKLQFASKNLSKNLADCNEVILFAATLGPEVDRILARYSKINVSRAVVFQAAAAAAIEDYCNMCQKEIESQMLKEGLYLRPRFSPGYGDVPLAIQKDFLELIKSTKTVGIILTEGDIMIPEKSVTAFMGISSKNDDCPLEGCEICQNVNCAYRR